MVAKFAVVKAYTSSHKAQIDSGLWYAFNRRVNKKVVLFDSLSAPKITASDEEDPAKLWIINC